VGGRTRAMIQPWPYSRVVAHRGGANLAPENTLPAFDQAARLGHHCVECDVALSADDVPMLLHDDSLERTTDGTGRLADWQSADLQRLDAGAWFHPRFAATRIPSLEMAIACWRRNDQQALIELKLGADQDPERLGTIIARTTKRCWLGSPPLFISFSAVALAAARRAAPGIPRALLLESWPTNWLQQAHAVQACAIDIDARLADPSRIATIHAAGLHLAVWTVNDRESANRLFHDGVDAVTTDAIDLIPP
jgi:glycerophosphoryl diester phosphodiesterase